MSEPDGKQRLNRDCQGVGRAAEERVRRDSVRLFFDSLAIGFHVPAWRLGQLIERKKHANRALSGSACTQCGNEEFDLNAKFERG